MTVETVFKQRDNLNIVNFSDMDGNVIDFAATTRMVLKFEGSTVVADTAIDPTLINFSIGGGDVSFQINDLLIAEGEYSASLIQYDLIHVDGQIVVHADDNFLLFRFVDPI